MREEKQDRGDVVNRSLDCTSSNPHPFISFKPLVLDVV